MPTLIALELDNSIAFAHISAHFFSKSPKKYLVSENYDDKRNSGRQPSQHAAKYLDLPLPTMNVSGPCP